MIDKHVDASHGGVLSGSFLRTFAIVTAACLAAFVTFEICIRTWVVQPANTVADAELGWVYQPHSDLVFSDEGFSRTTVDRLGFNNREVPEGRSIAVLGDSYVEALQLDRADNLVSQLGAHLVCQPTYNLGRSALSPLYYPRVVERVSGELNIARIVLVLNTGDHGNMRFARFNHDRPFKDYDDVAIRLPQQGRVRQLLRPVFENSALLYYLGRRLREAVEDDNQSGAVPIAPIVQAEDKRWRDAFVLSLRALKQQDPNLLAVFVPRLEYLAGRQVQEAQASMAARTAFADLARSEGVELHSIGDAYVAHFEKTGEPSHGYHNGVPGTGHINHLGHTLLADRLAHWLASSCGASA